jgi:hypothetical protein
MLADTLFKKLKGCCKKNKPIKKLLKKMPQAEQQETIRQFLSQPGQLATVLKLTTSIDPKYVCPLSKAIIKDAVRTLGCFYENAAIKTYVIRNGATPCGTPINLNTIGGGDGLRVFLQPDAAFTTELLTYAKVRLSNITALLQSNSDELTMEQTQLTEVLLTLLDLVRPSKGDEDLTELLLALEPYTELTPALFQALPIRWGRSTIEEMRRLLMLPNLEAKPSLHANILTSLAHLYEEEADYQSAKGSYDKLYAMNLAEEDDWARLARLLIMHFWSSEVFQCYPNPDFHVSLLKAAKELDRQDVIIGVSQALALSSSGIYEKAGFLNEILVSQFDNAFAQDEMVNQAPAMVEIRACQPYFNMLSRVLKARKDYELLAKFYSPLQPKEVLNDSHENQLLAQVAQKLESLGSIDFAVEAYNLLGGLYLVGQDYQSSSEVTQHILDNLDKTNAEAMNRLESLARATNKLSLLAKYSVRSVVDSLFPSGDTEKKSQAVIAVGQLIGNFEQKIDRSADFTQQMQDIQRRLDDATNTTSTSIASCETGVNQLRRENEHHRQRAEELKSTTARLEGELLSKTGLIGELKEEVERVKAKLEASQLHAGVTLKSLEDVKGYVSHLQSQMAKQQEANAEKMSQLEEKITQLEARASAPQANEASAKLTTEQRISSLQRQFDELAALYATSQAN